MKYRKIVISCALFIGCIGLYVFLKQASMHHDADQLVMGTAAGYAPFVSINPQGEYEGFDSDVAEALAKKLGKKLALKDLGSMTSLFMALDQGAIDAVIWGLSITQDRLKKVAMVHYQGQATASYPLIFWKTIPPEIKSLSDMKNKTICVEPGSSQEAIVSKYDAIRLVPIEKVDDALLNIQYGKTDAAFVEPVIAKKFKNKYPEIQILDVQLAPEDQERGVGIMIKKDRAELIKNVQQAIKALKEEGLIKRFEQKWGMAE